MLDIGGSLTNTQVAAGSIQQDLQSVVTASLGSRIAMGERFWWHGGLRYDPSPTGDDELSIDLWHITTGVSLLTENTASSIGLHIVTGSESLDAVRDIAGNSQTGGDATYFSAGLIVATNFFLKVVASLYY